ncbi:MAG TPA: LuxR C-terminal-related transcriptional regulator [Puia sp.]
MNPLVKHKSIILYGVALALLTFLLKWLEWRLVIFDYAIEIYIGAIALVFTGLGIWLAMKLTKPRVETVVIEKPVYIEKKPVDEEAVARELARMDLSRRELEVLELMAQGLSNQEIAEKLFVSLNTIKTHTSRLFEKMDVKRRTQAVEKAKRLNIIP